MRHELSRREIVQSGLALLACPMLALGQSVEITKRRFRVVETTGLRRFGFPISVVIDDVGDARDFRLSREGKAVVAQFRRVQKEGAKDVVVLDFNSNVGPLETEEYEVAFGKDVPAGPEPRSGLQLERIADKLRVGHKGGLRWEMPADLSTWLTSVGDGKREFLGKTPASLWIVLKDGSTRKLGDPRFGGRSSKITVSREGPLAIALHHSAEYSANGPTQVRSDLRFTFVSSKSWIEVDWAIQDPGRSIESFGFDLPLKIDGPPTLVDFGASSLVYAQMRQDEQMRMTATWRQPRKPGWEITRKGSASPESPFAVSAPSDGRLPEGWLHVADKTRCTAIAIADFAHNGTDWMQVAGDGLVVARRNIDPNSPHTTKRMKFWVHVVPTPVQVGAATSPQAMLGVPSVAWLPRGG